MSFWQWLKRCTDMCDCGHTRGAHRRMRDGECSKFKCKCIHFYWKDGHS